jgi:hypothetical protein
MTDLISGCINIASVSDCVVNGTTREQCIIHCLIHHIRIYHYY